MSSIIRLLVGAAVAVGITVGLFAIMITLIGRPPEIDEKEKIKVVDQEGRPEHHSPSGGESRVEGDSCGRVFNCPNCAAHWLPPSASPYSQGV